MPSKPIKISSNSLAIAGEFAVLSQLALRGIDANLTLGHTKSVDILGSDPTSGRMFRLEVKTSFNSRPSNSELFGRTIGWIMSRKHESMTDSKLFYCFVNITHETNLFHFYVVPSAIVARSVAEQHQYWLAQSREGQKPHQDTDIRRFRLGFVDETYPVFTPLAQDYEGKWELLVG